MVLAKIDRFLLDRNASTRRRSRAMTASVASKCIRWMFYEVTGHPYDKPPKPDLDLMYIFHDGNTGQDVFVALMREAGIEIIKEEFPVFWRKMYARVDSRVKADGDIFDIEFKRFDTNRYNTWLRYGVEGFPDYDTQTQIINAGSNQTCLFVVQNKNWGIPGEEIVERKPELLEQIYANYRDFESSRKTGTPPERPYEFGAAECQGCTFQHSCWFGQLVEEKENEEILTEEERERVAFLVNAVRNLRETVEQYEQWYGALDVYLGILHERYAVKKLELAGVTSSVVVREEQVLDEGLLTKFLKSDQIDQLYVTAKSSYVSKRVKWNE